MVDTTKSIALRFALSIALMQSIALDGSIALRLALSMALRFAMSIALMQSIALDWSIALRFTLNVAFMQSVALLSKNIALCSMWCVGQFYKFEEGQISVGACTHRHYVRFR